MRKTQFALAALALVASSAALAEGVTVYGTIDAGLANSTGNSTYVSGAGGFVAGNNIGFKGTEDLGAGLKANFQLEAGFDTNGHNANGGAATTSTTTLATSESVTTATTTTRSPIFNRIATVGLSGDFGTLNIGQQLSPFVASVAGTGTLGVGHFFVNRLVMGGTGAAGGVAGSAFAYGGFFLPNAISYTSPSFSGFSATALTTTKTGSQDGKVPAASNTERYTAISITGAISTVNVSAAYQDRAAEYSAWALSANTTVSGIKVVGNYLSSKVDGGTALNSYNIGAGYDVTPALNLNVQYAWNDLSGANQSLTGIAAKYTLSKRTFTYASYTRGTEGAQSNYDNRGLYTAGGASNNTVAVGVAHSF
ncbi:MAG: porin [Burkholderiaceae bacterium]